MLLNVLRDQNPEYVAVSFDIGKTFRHDMYQQYKGHRERTPEELEPQVRRIEQIISSSQHTDLHRRRASRPTTC